MAEQNKLADLLAAHQAKQGNKVHDGSGLFPIKAPGTGLLGMINSLNGQPTVQGVWYNGKDVTLDGYTFVGCRFDNCRLTISSPNFSLVRCHIDPTCIVVYGGNVNRVVQLFNAQGFAPSPAHLPFYPDKHPDGTLSIGA